MMTNKLYKLMNWPRIEEIIYSESQRPGEVLGAHQVGTSTLIQAFFPRAKRVSLCVPSLDYDKNMELADEDGFYAALVPTYGKFDYYFLVKNVDGESVKVIDPYSFDSVFDEKDLERFSKGIHYSVYRLLGAHPKELKGVKGVSFAVWAPMAQRVSVVGDFNNWDGRIHQMNLLKDTGIFEIFIPGIGKGEKYKFEIKLRDGLTYLKADPYAFCSELRPANASVISDTDFEWHDSEWIKKRTEFKNADPLSVYEVYLGSFPADLGYKGIADEIIEHVKETGYTHVEIMPVMDYTDDSCLGFDTSCFYAPTARYGTPSEFAELIDKLHMAGIGVILDWAPSHFPRLLHGLSDFDGSKLYENPDPKRMSYNDIDALRFNYSRFEVSNFLIANGLFWIERYHADGLRIPSVSRMLYLDYGKADGEWSPNMYGGNEDLDAIEFIKHFNSISHKRNPGIITIAEENSAYPKVTAALDDEGLGFDFKWNIGWTNDFVDYIKFDPYFRAHHHNDLTFSMIYAYSDRFILPLSHDLICQDGMSLVQKMPGDEFDKNANLRLSLAYMYSHPGRKHIFMGEDDGFNPLLKALNELYLKEPALSVLDDYSDGFEWINCISPEKCYLSFLRKGENDKDLLLVVANFAGIDQKLKIGVPFPGTYKEIFNSDDVKFGGNKQSSNKRARKAFTGEWDGRQYFTKIDISKLSLIIYKFMGE